MDNYKITASVEAVSLFSNLGYDVSGLSKESEFLFAKAEDMSVYNYVLEEKGYQELTRPQLRDLVVLHRNDVKDANCVDKKGEDWYLTSEGKYYAWQYRAKHWDVESDSCIAAHDIKPIQKPQPEQGLISGANVFRALADGKNVEFNSQNKWLDIRKYPWDLNIILNNPNGIKFRLKPHTTKIELEIPAPFEPKEGDLYWHISPEYMNGYGESMYNDGNVDTWQQFGAWRTEEEIKQVVAALRGIKG